MKIKSVLHILKEIKYMKSVIKKYGDLLSCGKYILFDGFRAMSLNDTETLKRAHIYFDKPGISPRMASIAQKLNKISFFANKNKKSTAEYDAIYTANNFDKEREVKLFSFKKNRILTICTSHEEKDKQISQYELFGKAYSMPEVKENKNYTNSFEISMIGLKNFPGDDMALKAISRSTIDYNPKIDGLIQKRVSNLISYDYNNEEMASLLDDLSSKIDQRILDMHIPLCVQHGDLSKDNLLFGEADGKTNFWWIDWEHAKERVFFYDYFFYIMNSAMYYDTLAYEHYMSGNADEDLKNFFAHFGLDFIPEKKRDYYLVFAIIFLKERVCDLGHIATLKTYCKFINTPEIRTEKLDDTRLFKK